VATRLAANGNPGRKRATRVATIRRMSRTAPLPLRIPLLAWLTGLPGALCLGAGVALLAGDFGALHPLLGEPATALALLVSAAALLGSAAFPLALARLADRDRPQ
jgi:hypothetical protein